MNYKIFWLFVSPVSSTFIGLHSLLYYITVINSNRTQFAEFTAVGQVDKQQIMYYDCDIKNIKTKTEWLKTENENLWSCQKGRLENDEDDLKVLFKTVIKNVNSSKELLTMQRMYGCEIIDGNIKVFDQYSFNGEDFLSLNVDGTWTAATKKALKTKQQWEDEGYKTTQNKYLETTCIDWLNEYVSYEKEIMEKNGSSPPEVQLFRKSSSSPELVCHATGFFPEGVMMSWQKDGEEVEEDVELRETLPNQDGSFQKRIILRISPEDLQKNKYTCVIQHSSLKEDLELVVSESGYITDRNKSILFIVVLAVLCCVVGIFFRTKKTDFKLVSRKPDSEKFLQHLKHIPRTYPVN